MTMKSKVDNEIIASDSVACGVHRVGDPHRGARAPGRSLARHRRELRPAVGKSADDKFGFLHSAFLYISIYIYLYR